MAKQDRISFDLKGLRERIERYRSSAEWQALSMSKRIRLLIEAGLHAEAEQEKNAATANFLKQLALGQLPSDADLVIAAKHLDIPEESLIALRKRLLNGDKECLHNGD